MSTYHQQFGIIRILLTGLIGLALASCNLLPGAANSAIPVATSAPASTATPVATDNQGVAVAQPTTAAITVRSTATKVANTPTTTTEAVESFGILGDVSQKVSVKPSAKATEHPGVFGEALPLGAELNTDEKGRARVVLENGTTIRLAPNSHLVLTERQQPESGDLLTQINLLVGQVWVILGRGAKETLQVETPIGVGAVRGSFLSVLYLPGVANDPTDDILIITCLEGDCELVTPLGTVKLTTGQKIGIVGKGNAPTGPVPMTREDIQEWIDNNVEILILFGVFDGSQTGQPPQSFGPVTIQIPGIGEVFVIVPPTETPTPTPTPTSTTPSGGGGATLPTATTVPANSLNWPNKFNGRVDGLMVMVTGLVLGTVGVRRIKRRKQ
jgi:hypothetical protein